MMTPRRRADGIGPAGDEGATLAHSTNEVGVIAGAGTMSLEMLEQGSLGSTRW